MICLTDIYPVEPALHSGSYIAGLVRCILMRSNFVMHSRQALGWRGLRPVCKGGEGWTCRIDGKEGVYGLSFKGEEEAEDGIRATFSLCYFPEPGEKIIDQYAIQAALYTQFPQYNGMVRDFLSYPDFYGWFETGKVSVFVATDRAMVWTSLTSQDLQAFDLAFPFFEVLVSTMADALECDVRQLVQAKSGENKLVRAGFGIGAFRGEGEIVISQWERGSIENRPFPDARWWAPMEVFAAENEETDEDGRNSLPELFVLTGFLGSGKTTFLKQFIEYHVSFNRFVAVIQNEIGEQGLDGKLLEDDYAVMEMDEGCVCCSLIGQLKKGIANILNDHHPDIIILETTGLANPYNLLAELGEIKNLVRFESICSVVDGKNFNHSADYSEIAVDQVKAADQIILNKIDLLRADQQAELVNQIRKLNPDAEIFPCSFGKVNPSQLSWRSEKAGSVLRKAEIHHDHSEEGISSRKQIFRNTLDRQYLLSEMKKLPESIFRVKGVVDIEGQNAPCVVQYVNGICSLEEMTLNIPEERFLVFIGKSNALHNQSIFIN